MEWWSSKSFNQAKPYLAVIFMQFVSAGSSIISKFALNQGMSQHVFVVYRYAIATAVISPFAFFVDRKVRPKMTWGIFLKIALLALLEPTIDQNLYYTAMKYTTATFAASMNSILPAFAFLMAWGLGLERVELRKFQSQAKILGTVVTVGGAMLMAAIKGARLDLPWTKGIGVHAASAAGSAAAVEHPIKGALMIGIGCICWAAFVNLQAITLKSYPGKLSLTALICMMGTIEGSVVAVGMEWGNPSAWTIGFDTKLLAAFYSGIMSSGILYSIQGVVMQSKGPVFVTAFGPLSMVIVAILGSILLSEILYMGRLVGAMVIVTGLYMVLWGKSRDEKVVTNITANDKVTNLPLAVNVAAAAADSSTTNVQKRESSGGGGEEEDEEEEEEEEEFVSIEVSKT
ncbi:WAT1-related protein At2g39510 [Linum grandiflorum]